MQMKKGKLRRVDTSAVQRETWVNTPDGWRLKLVDDVHPGAWFVDGSGSIQASLTIQMHRRTIRDGLKALI
jgi:hypothetical protein